jgi:hypothetical protein
VSLLHDKAVLSKVLAELARDGTFARCPKTAAALRTVHHARRFWWTLSLHLRVAKETR